MNKVCGLILSLSILFACGPAVQDDAKQHAGSFALNDDSGLPSCNSMDANSADVVAEAEASVEADVDADMAADTSDGNDGAPPPGVTFFDDFSGSSLSSEWAELNRHTDYSNSEVGCYQSANITVASGDLSIETRVENATCGDATHTSGSEQYTSGAVQWATRSFNMGTVEIRAKLPGGIGTWPALWLLGTNCQSSFPSTADNIGTCNWPNPGSDEIDILDQFGSDRTQANEAVHGSGMGGSCTVTVSDMSQNWHVYQLVRTASSLTWKIDGVQTCQLSAGQFPTSQMFLIINTSMRNVDGSTLPQTMLVDYVMVSDAVSDAGAGSEPVVEAGSEPTSEPQVEPAPEPAPEAGPEPVVEAGTDVVDAGSDVVDAAQEAEASAPRVLVGESTAWLPGAPTNGVADSVNSGEIEAFKYTSTTPGGNSTKLYFYATVSSRTVKLGIYSNNSASNQPQTLLMSGAFTSVVGWNTVTIPSSPIASNSFYWIAVLSTNGSISFVEKSDSPGVGLGSLSAGSGVSALPATWSTTGQVRWNSSGMSAYAKE